MMILIAEGFSKGSCTFGYKDRNLVLNRICHSGTLADDLVCSQTELELSTANRTLKELQNIQIAARIRDLMHPLVGVG